MAFVNVLAYAAGLVAVAAMAIRLYQMMRHVTIRTERGYVTGAGSPVDIVRRASSFDTWTGDVLVTEVCRCGATRPIGTSRWNRLFCRCK